MSKKKNHSGLTRQGVRSLDHIKGPSVGRKYEPPSSAGMQCTHFGLVREIDYINGISQCSGCKARFDYEGGQF